MAEQQTTKLSFNPSKHLARLTLLASNLLSAWNEQLG